MMLSYFGRFWHFGVTSGILEISVARMCGWRSVGCLAREWRAGASKAVVSCFDAPVEESAGGAYQKSLGDYCAAER